MPSRTYARTFVLANWLGFPFETFQINRYLTGLEGDNGAGKTTVIIGYVTTLMPNQKLLNFPNVGADSTREGHNSGLWGRLGADGTAYSVIEWIDPEGRSIWAGVTLKRLSMPSVEIKPFIIDGLPSTLRPTDAFLICDEGTSFVPSFARLREHLTLLGARVIAYRSVTEYLHALFEYRITPLPMATYDEQERFYRVLATSMMGSSLGAIAKTGLRNYLLTEDPSLEKRVNIMRDCLEECRQTKRELDLTQKAHDEIHDLYDAAWRMASFAYFGTRVRFELANEAWRAQVRMTRNERDKYAALERLFADIQQRLVELDEQEAADNQLVLARQATLDRANKALELRPQVPPANDAVCRAEQAHAAAVRARTAAEARESAAAMALANAQREHTEIASEMANLNQAVEGLMHRVIRLHRARAAFSRARSVVGKHVTAHNAETLRTELQTKYDTLTNDFNTLRLELDSHLAHREQFNRLFSQLKAVCACEGTRVSATTAYARAVELDGKLRDRQSAADRLPSLLSDRVRMARLSDQQDEAHAAAFRLGLRSAEDLLEKSGAHRDSIARQDTEREKQIQQKNTILTELATVSDTIRRLEESDKIYQQGREFHQTLRELDANLSALAKRDDLQHARDDAGTRHRLVEERRHALEVTIQSIGTSIRGLRINYGTADPLIGSVAEQVDGTLLSNRFEQLNLEEAARMQARLGNWLESIVVPSPEGAALIASQLEDRPDTLYFVGEDCVSVDRLGASVGDSELVGDGLVSSWVRLTRRPTHPVLGSLARKAEMERLEALRRNLEDDLNVLLAHSGVLTEILAAADRYLLLGPAAWREDPGPALAHERLRSTALRTTHDSLDKAIVQASRSLEHARELQRRYDELEPRRELLDPPLYRDKVRELDAEITASHHAVDWLVAFAQDVRGVLNELPTLRTPPDNQILQRRTAAFAQIESQRQVAVSRIEALAAFVLVAGDLRYAGDEVVHKQKSSVIESLKRRLELAEVRLKKATKSHATAAAAAVAARDPVNEADATLNQRRAVLTVLITRLNETGMQGTEEEAASASDALIEANTALNRTRSAHTSASEQKGKTEGDLSRAQETLVAMKREGTEKCQIIRSERSAKRELDALVAEQRLSSKIGSEANRQELIPGGISPIRAFEEARAARAILLDRLKAHSDVHQDIQALDVEGADERRAIQALKMWARVLEHIEQRIPRNIASTDDPRLALAQMLEKLKELRRTLDAQEQELRHGSIGVSNAIRARLRTAGRLIRRLNRELETVQFGSIQGVCIKREDPPYMMEMLKALEAEQTRSLFDTDITLDEILTKLYERIGGRQIKGGELLDYRNYVILHLAVQRLDGTWDTTANLSTGEAIGVGASILVMILRTWNEEPRRISGASSGFSMQQILLDEANRLDPEALDRLTEFCQRMDVQALVAAPSLAQPRSSTIYTLVRGLQDGRELVTIEGRRFAA